MVHYKLYYFDVRGLGETIRLLLTYGGEKFEDERFTFENWPQNKQRFAYGKVPVLEVDGKQLAETSAIASYLGNKYGLSGKDEWEKAKVIEFASFHRDAATEVGPYIRSLIGFMPGDNEALRRDTFIPAVEKYYPIYVKAIKESGSGFIAKSGLTYVDFTVAEFFNTIIQIEGEVMKKYPELVQYVQRVHAVPQIKKYVETRKVTKV